MYDNHFRFKDHYKVKGYKDDDRCLDKKFVLFDEAQHMGKVLFNSVGQYEEKLDEKYRPGVR